MERYEFDVLSIHPLEYRVSFFSLFDKEKAKGSLYYRRALVPAQTAPPPELIRDWVFVSAATLTIIKHIYDFYKEIKSKKGKVYVRIDDEDYDLEAYNVDELKAKIVHMHAHASQKRKKER